ncbi:hypothetical protein GWK47_013443 [Chionoecetes opilio]|uniref:Uncharacterized protein n=1 Tax=Chionoecetes opilio TaxID=41210 RepID=A0A8J5CNY0_CHIOP|nr:hypothetical protein GWK47_013443 [Chionoecetes opilio]
MHVEAQETIKSVSEPAANAPPPGEAAEVVSDHSLPEEDPDAEAILPAEQNYESSQPENLPFDDKMKGSELLTTAHMHFKDEEPLMPITENFLEENK